jgi:hypothetical protein
MAQLVARRLAVRQPRVRIPTRHPREVSATELISDEGRGLYMGKYPPPPWRGANKYGLMGKKYHENNVRADKKGEKERKDKGREKISDKMTEQEQCFIKL